MTRKRLTPKPWSKAGSPPELVAAALGAVLVFGAIGYMTVEALTTDGSPPLIEIIADSVIHRGDAFLVEFQVRNHGQTPAARLAVEGELMSDSVAVEVSDVVIDYLPAGGVRRAGLLFTRDPARHRLELRAKGYDRP